jgi:predicted kinase
MLTVVVGPPAGGKSTWVLERAKHGDIVIDFDRLAVALTGHGGDPHDHAPAVMGVTRAVRQAAIDAALKHAHDTDVYLIHSSPGRQRMAQYRGMGAKVVTIDPGKDVVRERCKTQRPRRMFAVIDEWYRDQQSVTTAPVKPARVSPAHSFPSPTTRAW